MDHFPWATRDDTEQGFGPFINNCRIIIRNIDASPNRQVYGIAREIGIQSVVATP